MSKPTAITILLVIVIIILGAGAYLLFFWEKLAKSYQLKIMPQDLKAMMNQDSRVVVNEKFLKFHRHDSRRAVQEKFDESVSRLVG